MNMKFIKGMVVGTMVSAGVMMMWSDTKNSKTLIKKGRKIAKRMGMM